jgi:hypothetical protein
VHSKTDRFLSGLRALASLELRSREAVSGAVNALIEPFLYKMHHFAKTGSGQNRETQKKSGVFHNSMHSSSAGGGSTVNDEEHSGSHKQQNLSKTVSDKTSQDLITAMCFVLCSLLCRVEELSTRLGEALISSGRE